MLRPIAALLLCVALPAVAATPTADQTVQGEKASDDKDKMVCKRFADTGSLVSSHRVCKPKREWERARDNSSSMNAANSCKASGEGLNCN
jgi:hypothetical protein